MRFGPDPDGRRLQRLTVRPQFLAVQAGKRFHASTCTVQALPRKPERTAAIEPDATGLRVGFTITKRVGHATERNRIRRRLRVAIRQACGAVRDQPLDLVVVGRRDALSVPFDRLVSDLSRAIAGAVRPKRGSAPNRAPDITVTSDRIAPAPDLCDATSSDKTPTGSHGPVPGQQPDSHA